MFTNGVSLRQSKQWLFNVNPVNIVNVYNHRGASFSQSSNRDKEVQTQVTQSKETLDKLHNTLICYQ